MLFKFLCVNRTQAHFNLCVISLYSITEEQARLSLSADFRHIATVARINRTFSPVQNHSLPNKANDCSICGTTTIIGHRTRKTCDFFVSKIPFKGLLHPENIEFAVRLIRRTKAEYIRTNKASRVIAVVETVSHLLAIYPFNLTKTITAMKNPIQKPTTLLAAYFPIVSTSTQGGLANA